MQVLLNLSFSSPQVATFNIAIILFIIMGIIAGYKQGFLETSVKFLGTILAIVLAYALKTPVATFLYTNFPFFKLGGIFKGVSSLNILIYELIAFMIVFAILFTLIKIICNLTGLIDRVLSFIFLFGIPNKILGAIVGFIQSIVILYFLIYVIQFGCNLFGFTMQESLADDIMNVPILKGTFSKNFDSLNEIAELSSNYKSINSKDEYNFKALDILLKNNLISCENAKMLVDEGKLNIENVNELLTKCK